MSYEENINNSISDKDMLWVDSQPEEDQYGSDVSSTYHSDTEIPCFTVHVDDLLTTKEANRDTEDDGQYSGRDTSSPTGSDISSTYHSDTEIPCYTISLDDSSTLVEANGRSILSSTYHSETEIPCLTINNDDSSSSEETNEGSDVSSTYHSDTEIPCFTVHVDDLQTTKEANRDTEDDGQYSGRDTSSPIGSDISSTYHSDTEIPCYTIKCDDSPTPEEANGSGENDHDAKQSERDVSSSVGSAISRAYHSETEIPCFTINNDNSSTSEETNEADGHEWQCERCTLYNSTYRTHCQACVAQRPRQEPAQPNVSTPHPLIYSHDARPQYDGRIGWSGNVCPDKERRIVFIGRTGSGKSATGNNILNKIAFESSACGSSVTKKCQRGTAKRFGRDIQIIDSPGLFDTEMENGDITREVVKCVGMTAPGPHAFVLVVRIDRFTKEENETVQYFKQVFGEGMLNHLIILFTRKDDLAHEKKTLTEYLKKVPQDLQDLASACNHRCIAFNNRGSEEEREQDVQNFLGLVDSVIMDNGGNCYTSEMYVEAEKNMKKREEELRREHERRAEEERNAIRQLYELKFRRQNKEQSDITKQMKKWISELEQEKTEQSKKNDSEADIALLVHEMKELKMALKGVEEEKKESDKKLQEERERREREAEKRLEAEKEDFREKAREEVNEEKSGFMGFLGSVLPTLVSAALPSFLPAAGKLLMKVFKK